MKKWILFIVAFFLIVAATVLMSIYVHLNGVTREIQAKGEELAKKTPITKVEEVDVYYGKEECLVVQGKDAKGNALMAWFVKDKVEVDNMNRLVTKKSVIDALKKSRPNIKIIHVTPGKEGDTKFWEIVFLDQNDKYNYYYIDMYTGKLISTYLLEKAA